MSVWCLASGGVYFVNGAGGLSQQFTADGPVRRLLYYEEKNILITVSANMMLVQHSVAADGETREIIKVRDGGGEGGRRQRDWDQHVVGEGKWTLDGGMGWGHWMRAWDGEMGWGKGDGHGVR